MDKILICKGFSDIMNEEKAAELGISGFLMKPVVRSEMAGMVRKVLDQAAARGYPALDQAKSPPASDAARE